MARFPQLSSQVDFPASEQEILEFWDKNDIYKKSLSQREGQTPFVFYEGPPTANGMPHPGHCLTRVMKDVFPRYKTMRGYYCERQAGWDTHGLPVEVEVSKEIGIHKKEEIEEYGIEPFIHRCVQSVFRYTREWEDLTKRLGFWVDLDAAYVTYHQSYVESVWWALKSMFDAGILYQGHKIVWWWAQGGTSLSSGEVGQGYKDVADPSIYVPFELIDRPDTSILIWTTTPWTLPGNHFVAVKPELEYSLVKDSESGKKFYVASDLVDDIAGRAKAKFEVVETCSGDDLLGLRYQPPFPFFHETLGEQTAELKDGGSKHIGWRIVSGDFVTTDAGTGLVHVAPAFGEDDYGVLIRERDECADPEAIPLLCPVASDGTFTEEVTPWAGTWVKDADKDIMQTLKAEGRLFHREQYLHPYPFCWRADQDPLIQYPRKSWFVRTTSFVEDMLANNQEINWLPEHIKAGRFGTFLESNVDWALSRERYWGTPLPIWVCEETGHKEAIASYQELLSKPGITGTEVFEEAKKNNPDVNEHLKVHRPYIDSITYDSPKAPGARMRRVPEVIDCWFDSGAMPFAQFGWPHQNQERFGNAFPADFISEALDQTRGWFYSLLAIATLLFGKNGVAKTKDKSLDFKEWPMPYRNCVVLGLIKGEDGLKMSKSKKNYKTPDHIFKTLGADAMRWLFLSTQSPGSSVLFKEAAISEAQRAYMARLQNILFFFTTYANIDEWQPKGGVQGSLPDEDLSELDRWILSELNRVTAAVTEAMDRFDTVSACGQLSRFVEGLSNWYVRRSRSRFWGSGMTPDKNAAFSTLYHTLVTTALLSAPFVPFMTESLYRNLVASRDDDEFPESVHLCEFPEPEEARLDQELNDRMTLLIEIASLGRAARVGSGLKVRQPLSMLEIVLANTSHSKWLMDHKALIAEELNVKEVALIEDADDFVDYVIKPNFPSIGPKYQKLVKRIAATLSALEDPAAYYRELSEKGVIYLEIDGESVELTSDDIEIRLKAKEGWSAAQGVGAVVVINTEITEELRREGLAREIVHHVQGVRKSLNLQYEQRIELGLDGDPSLLQIAKDHQEYLCHETLSTALAGPGRGDPQQAIEIEGAPLRIWVSPA